MKRVIIVPQLKIAMRYTDWWADLFFDELKNRLGGSTGWQVVMLEGSNSSKKKGTASSTVATVSSLEKFQQAMVEHELKMITSLKNMDLEPTDILVCLDVCTPGLIASFLQNIQRNKRPATMGFCHGSSFNTGDMYHGSRQVFDLACMSVFNRILVATNYHADKLTYAGVDHCKIRVSNAFPDNPYYLNSPLLPRTTNRFSDKNPVNNVAIVDRFGQKRNNALIKEFTDFANQKGIPYQLHDLYGVYDTWEKYIDFLSCCHYMLVTTCEETYGYQVRDALFAGVIPICPASLSFPEVLNPVCLYEKPTLDCILNTMSESMNFIQNNDLEKHKLVDIFTRSPGCVESFFTNVATEIVILSTEARPL